MDRRTVLVTGCTAGGIGYCWAEEFAAHGYLVFASARRLEAMQGLPSDVRRIVLDVTSKNGCKQAVATVIKEAWHLDIMVNAAGMGWAMPLLDTPIESFRAHHETNVAAPHMADRQSGLIINVGSGLGYFSIPFTGAHSASKHALHNLTDIMRLELNPLGIDVMLVAPGFVKASMTYSTNSHAFSKPSAFGY